MFDPVSMWPRPDILRSELWPTLSVHQDYWERRNCSLVYEYDPTEDGPEWFVTRVILACHTSEELLTERWITAAIRREITKGGER